MACPLIINFGKIINEKDYHSIGKVPEIIRKNSQYNNVLDDKAYLFLYIKEKKMILINCYLRISFTTPIFLIHGFVSKLDGNPDMAFFASAYE